MSVEISNLPELVAQLTTLDYSPVVHNGVTYKHKTGSYVVRNSGNETVNGVKIFTSSPVVPTATVGNQAVNKTQMDAADSTISAKATPLSDLNRVVQITGDGVPMFPDNVAGTLQKFSSFVNTVGFTYIGCTGSIEGNRFKVTVTASAWAVTFPALAAFTNALVTVGYQAPAGRQVRLYTVGSVSTILAAQLATGSKQVISGYNTVSNTYVTLNCSGYTNGDIVYIDFEYIGSGLYDTPVYDKACCNRATNNGALPVPAPRGLGLALNGAQYLQFDNPVIGTTGTIAFKFKRGLISTLQRIMSNREPTAGFNGLSIQFPQSTNTCELYIAGASTGQSIATPAITDTTTWHTVVFKISGTVLSYSFDNASFVDTAQTVALTQSVTNLVIGAYATLVQNYNGLLADLRIESRLWTQDDVTRYNNGDDAVDSQQKSNIGTPHALAVYGADGGLKAHSGATVMDTTNIAANVVANVGPYAVATTVEISSDYTVASGVGKICITTANAINITIPEGLPLHWRISVSRTVASANAITALRSGLETIEGGTSFIIQGSRATASLAQLQEVTLEKITSTEWRFVAGIVSGSTSSSTYTKTPDGYGFMEGSVTTGVSGMQTNYVGSTSGTTYVYDAAISFPFTVVEIPYIYPAGSLTSGFAYNLAQSIHTVTTSSAIIRVSDLTTFSSKVVGWAGRFRWR